MDRSKGASLLLSLAAALLTGSLRGSAGAAGEQQAQPPVKPGMTIDDILGVVEVQEPTPSSDGRRVAFIAKRASVKENRYRYGLHVAEVERRQTIASSVDSPDPIVGLAWTADGERLRYCTRTGTGGTAMEWKAGGRARPLVTIAGPLRSCEWSADARTLLAVSAAPTNAAVADDFAGGIVIDHDHAVDDTFREVIDRVWLESSDAATVAVYGETDRWRKRDLWSEKPGHTTLTAARLSPDGKAAAIAYRARGEVSTLAGDLDVLATSDGAVQFSARWPGVEQLAAWSSDGHLTFISPGPSPATPPATRLYQWDARAGGAAVPAAPFTLRPAEALFAPAAGRLVVQRTRLKDTGLFAIDAATGSPRRLTPEGRHVSACKPIGSTHTAACIVQTTMEPPEVAIVDLERGTIGERVSSVNAQVAQRTLGRVVEREWTNKYGRRAHGYLVLPVGYVEGRRYPTLLAMYDFTNKFIADAQWVTSFPTQAYAASGFAVLLMNFAEPHPFTPGDVENAMINLIHNPVDGVRAAADLLVAEGVADPDRLGVMGFSRGCYITSMSVTLLDRFRAASCGDGFIFTPARYWMTMGRFQQFFRDHFGGHPFGPQRKAYEDVSPPLLAHRVKAATLLEYVGDNVSGLEWYTSLRANGVPAEYVAYPDEPHTFLTPRHRLGSMTRNLDWFRYWLLGESDPDPRKRTQYERWTRMRDARPSS